MLKKKDVKKTIISILATFSLTACATLTTGCKAPSFDQVVRRAWSFEFQECRCQWYDLNNQTKVSDFITCEEFRQTYFPDKPQLPNYAYCDDLVGFNAKLWATHLTPKGKEIRRWAEDECESR